MSPFKVLRLEPLLDLEIPRGKGRGGPKDARFNSKKAVAGRIARTVGGYQQVAVTIPEGGWSTSAGHSQRQLDYITDHGEIPAEDERGLVLSGLEVVRDAQRGWYLDKDPQQNARKSLHMVLSMGAGNDPEKVLEGVRRFAHEEFADRQYFLVLHRPGTVRRNGEVQPEHPHVHIQVKSLNDEGQRLRVGRSDLRRMREVFAEKMREQGVKATTSARIERGFAAQKRLPRAVYEREMKNSQRFRNAKHRLSAAIQDDYRIALAQPAVVEAIRELGKAQEQPTTGRSR
jgi:type IV secretion system T-DNA border endonuclease VirD2